MRIELTSGHTVLADDADLELLLPYSWHLCKNSNGRLYASARIRGAGPPYRRIKMHRLIMGDPPGMVVHHINNDGLDNRRCNLEVTTNRQNIQYHHDGIGGAYFDKQNQKWRSILRDNSGKRVSLGMFQSETDALEAANEFRRNRCLAI